MTECLDRDSVLSDMRSEYARLRTELEQLEGNMLEIIEKNKFIFELLEKIKHLFDNRKFEEVWKLISNSGFSPLNPNDPIMRSIDGQHRFIDQQYRLLVKLSKDIFACPCCRGTGRHPPQMLKGKVEEYGYDCSTCEGKGNLKNWIEPHQS